MTKVLQILLAVLLTLSLGAMVGFWVHPQMLAQGLGVGEIDGLAPLGRATLRADFGGFFGAGGLFTLYALARRRADLLAVPAVLLGLALFGRLVGFVADGGGRAEIGPIVVELVGALLCYTAMRTLPRA